MTTEAQEKAVVQYKGEPVTITFTDVKKYICPFATPQEVVIFLKTCQSLSLSPWANEIYLIKYSERDKAATVVAIDAYLKAGEANQNYDGHEAGVVLKDSTGKLEFREGSLILDGEYDRLIGGWAKVYRKDRTRPFYMAVNKAECIKYTKDGSPTKFWVKAKQPMMLRKTALKRAMVEAFPSLFAGTLSTAEVAEIEPPPEGELPPAYQRPNGDTDWKRFWTRQKSEKGLDEEKVHNMLGISSLKTDWLEQGRTLEEAEELINKALEQRAKPKKPAAAGKSNYQPVTTDMPDAAAEQAFTPPSESAAPTEVTPKQADWRAFWEQADQLGLSRDRACEMLGVGSVTEWTDQGKTLDEAIEVISKKLSEQASKTDEVAGESFSIDPIWLKEAKQTLKWTEGTMLTFINYQYKVTGENVTEALGKLTREQAEDFVKEINKRLEKQQSLF